LISRIERRDASPSAVIIGRMSSRILRSVYAASPITSTWRPYIKRNRTDRWPGVWPGVAMSRTLPSPSRSIVLVKAH